DNREEGRRRGQGEEPGTAGSSHCPSCSLPPWPRWTHGSSLLLKRVMNELLVVRKLTNDRMLIGKSELLLVSGLAIDQHADRPEVERSVAVCRLAGPFDRRRAVAPRQAQEALDDPYAFHPAGGNRRLGPANALRSDQPHAAQQPARAPLHSADLLRDDMPRVGAETPRLALGITGDQFHPVVEDPHHAGIPPHPDLASEVLRSDRVVRLVDLDVAVAVHRAPAFVEAGEATRRQGK